MGTRHYQVVIDKKGTKRVQQYGQWDGYPSGQGLNILKYLKSGDLEKYQSNLEKIKTPTKNQIEAINKELAKNGLEHEKGGKYYHFNRDCGSQMHQLIEDGKVKNVQLMTKEEADKWCEGFYTIDFQNNTFQTEYYGISKKYQLDNLPSEEQYLQDCTEKEEE